MILHTPGRPAVDLEISSCDAYPTYTYRLYAQYGGLTGTTTHIEWKYYKPREAPKQHLITTPLPGRQYCGERLIWHEKSWDLPEGTDLFLVMSEKIYRNIYDHLTKKTPLIVTPRQVRQQIAVIEECHRQNPLSRRHRSK